MLITSDFVFVHMPKTGGTFVRKHTVDLYRTRLARALPQAIESRLVRRGRGRNIAGRKPTAALGALLGVTEGRQHARRAHIPVYARDRPVLGARRHPLDWYVSQYMFGWWRDPRRSGTYKLGVKRFANFPDLSFDEFLEFTMAVGDQHGAELGLTFPAGRATVQLLRFYARDDDAYRDQDSAAVLAKAREQFSDVTLLDTNHLSEQLADYLARFDHPAPAIERVRTSGRILPPLQAEVRDERDFRSQYSAAWIDEIRTRDQLVFELFADYEL